VEGVTKISKMPFTTSEERQAETYRKMLLAMVDDIRVILVKLADRLHNMRTLEAIKPTKRKIVAEETMDIYAPLAGRMGMQWLREELEDHAFRALNAEGYAAVVERLTMLRKHNQGLIDEIASALTAKLKETKVAGLVVGREKKPYAIWSKMERKQISLEQLSDIYAFRIVVPDVEDCYRALGVLHRQLDRAPRADLVAAECREMERSVVIGRGYNYATAFEMALKLKELTYTVVEPYSSADFLHGPLAIIERGFPAIVLAPSGRLLQESLSLIATLKERQAQVICVSDRREALDMAPVRLEIPCTVAEWLSPLTLIVPGQLLAMSLAHARGHDVDSPRAIQKVTRTR